MTQTLKGKISIGRPSRSDGRLTIRMEITDSLSRNRFARFEMTPEDFALALTGLSEVDVEVELMNLNRVGKQKESKPLMVHLGYNEMLVNHLSSLDKRGLSDYMYKNATKWVDPDWEINPLLVSQNSLVYHPTGDGVILNLHQFRYVESSN